MGHIVGSCRLTQLNVGLTRLHEADDDAVNWLKTTAATVLTIWNVFPFVYMQNNFSKRRWWTGIKFSGASPQWAHVVLPLAMLTQSDYVWLCRMVLRSCGSVRRIYSRVSRVTMSDESCFVFYSASLRARSASVSSEFWDFGEVTREICLVFVGMWQNSNSTVFEYRSYDTIW